MDTGKILAIEQDVTKAVELGSGILGMLASRGSGGAINEFQAADIITELGNLVTKALLAWSNASGTPITSDSILALMPDDFPLNPPSSGLAPQTAGEVKAAAAKPADVPPTKPADQPTAIN